MIKIQWMMLTLAFSIPSLSSILSQDRNLRVGTALVDITPPVNPAYPPLGKYDHEMLYIRAIVLDNGETRAVIIGSDLPNVFDDIWSPASPLIEKEFICPVKNIFLSPTHSHTACPAGPSPPQFWEIKPEPVIRAMVNAVVIAKSKLQYAKIGYGTGSVYLNVYMDAIKRDSEFVTPDSNLESYKTLSVVMFTDLDSTPIADLINYAMHPINCSGTGITSADFPGAPGCYIENALKNEKAMIFTQGASGNQNPLWSRPNTVACASNAKVNISDSDKTLGKLDTSQRDAVMPKVVLDLKVVDNMERCIETLGIILGEETIRVMSNINQLEMDVRIWGALNFLTLLGRKRTNTNKEGYSATYEDGPQVDLRLGFLGIGNIALPYLMQKSSMFLPN